VRSAPLAVASIVATLALPSGALPGAMARQAAIARTATLGHAAPAMLRFGRSIGSPTEGRLVGGMHLDDGPGLRVVPAYSAGDVRWGLEPLVTMIERAAHAVRRQFPDTITSFGHLSRAGGGDLDRHRSHESGRDADLAFFVRGGGNTRNKQLLASHFVPFRGDGTAASWPGAWFDDARNWALVASLVSDPVAHVTHLFVASPLRARLLAYAERVGVPSELRMRAAEVMQQPHGTLPHDDHFHVRIGCPAHMSGCVENPAVRVTAANANNASTTNTTVQGHGRRGGARGAPLPITEPTTPTLAPASPAGAKPTRPETDSPLEPELPPASLPAPVDDVDG
jgi:penicillin-insensitive murein endopeptidase